MHPIHTCVGHMTAPMCPRLAEPKARALLSQLSHKTHVSDPCKPVRYELVELGQHAVPGLSGGEILLLGGILG